jgi:hypothetical protein
MRECFSCKTTKTYVAKNRKNTQNWSSIHWILGMRIWFCARCYGRYISKPRRLLSLRKGDQNRIYYKGLRPRQSEIPRTGHCSICLNNIYDGTCRRTHVHHRQYHDDNIMHDTIELCPACHKRQHIKHGRYAKTSPRLN